MWGRRAWQPWPISYQAQGLRRGGRNVEDEQKWSKLLEDVAEDNPVLGEPRSRKEKAAHPRRQSFQASQTKGPTQWASYRGMVEEQFQERLSPPH